MGLLMLTLSEEVLLQNLVKFLSRFVPLKTIDI